MAAPGTDTAGAGARSGRVYVLDGATGRIAQDRASSRRSGRCPASAGFGKAVSSLAGQPPCAGFGGDRALPPAVGSGVAIGDVDGGGQPDFVVGAPDYTELGDGGDYPGCPPSESCAGVGRVYVVPQRADHGSVQTPLGLARDDIATSSSSLARPAAASRLGSGPRSTPAGDLGACAEGDPRARRPASASRRRSPTSPTASPTSSPRRRVPTASDAGRGRRVRGRHGRRSPRCCASTPRARRAEPRSASFTQAFAAPGQARRRRRAGHRGRRAGVRAARASPSARAATSWAPIRLIRTFKDPSPVAGGVFGRRSQVWATSPATGPARSRSAPRAVRAWAPCTCERVRTRRSCRPSPTRTPSRRRLWCVRSLRSATATVTACSTWSVGVPGFDATRQRGSRTRLPADQHRAGGPGARTCVRPVAAPPAAAAAVPAAVARRLRPTTTTRS